MSTFFRKIALRVPWVVPGGMFVTVMRRGLGFGRREFWGWSMQGGDTHSFASERKVLDQF